MNASVLTGIVASLALILTLVLTAVVRRAALAGGLVRGVQDDRWHRRPTPAVGGVAIFLGFGLSVAGWYMLGGGPERALSLRPSQSLVGWTPGQGLLLASSAAFLLGLVDDLLKLRPLAKLAGQIAAASVLVVSGIGVWLTGFYAVDVVLSLFWFVGITNALNLLDNMDGLAAGVAAIAGAYLAVLFAFEGATELMTLAMAFTAALVGFLAHNYPPARIFMGDSGSLFVGLLLGGLALAPVPGLSRNLAAVLAAPVLILGVPILDTTLVTVGRLLEGRPVSEGGRDHTSHRLVALGLPETRTVWLLWGLAAAGGGAGLFLRTVGRGTALLLGGILVGALTLVGAYLLTVRLRSLETESGDGPPLYEAVVRAHARYPVLSLVLDGVWIGLAYYAAYLVRWEAAELPAELVYFARTLPLWLGAKLIGFIVSGVYSTHWPTFGLYDALRIGRANLVATLLAVALVLLVDRVGLSRGVVVIDLLACSLLTVGSRLSFRLMEGTTKRWADGGRTAVLYGPLAFLDGAAQEVERVASTPMRVVGLASPDMARGRGNLGSHPIYGGVSALSNALADTGASSVVLVGTEDDRKAGLQTAEDYLESGGGVDVFELEVRLTLASQSQRALEAARSRAAHTGGGTTHPR